MSVLPIVFSFPDPEMPTNPIRKLQDGHPGPDIEESSALRGWKLWLFAKLARKFDDKVLKNVPLRPVSFGLKDLCGISSGLASVSGHVATKSDSSGDGPPFSASLHARSDRFLCRLPRVPNQVFTSTTTRPLI